MVEASDSKSFKCQFESDQWYQNKYKIIFNMSDHLEETLDLIELRKKYQDKEDKFYRIGTRCNDIGSVFAFCAVGAIIGKTINPSPDPTNAQYVENIMLYSSWAAFVILMFSLVMACIMLYYMRKVDKIDKQFNFFA